MAQPVPLLRARGITKSFPGVRALDDVDLELHGGEIHTLAGENGSGKSTLAKILYGGLQADAGVVEVDGAPVQLGSPRRALELGIVGISQELTLAPTLSVAENVLMGRIPRRAGLVDWPAGRREARAALTELGVEVDPRVRVGALSMQLRQEVEVARALAARPRVLILDEATSAMTESATERLLDVLRRLAGDGVAVLFISHRLRELYACASRATVLRDGRRVCTVPLPQTPEPELVRNMVGREITDLYAKRRVEVGEPVLRVAGLSSLDGSVRDVSLEVRAGEILGIGGLVGSGKSSLALALAGALPSAGEVSVAGRAATLRTPRAAMAAGIRFVPEDRKREALFPTRSVRQNLSAGWMDRLTRFGLVDVFEERRLAAATAKRFDVRARSLDAPIVQLSGGNQQKVVLGRWFGTGGRVLVLAEPTRGIDVGAKSEVYRFVQELAADGMAIVMVSSELPELLGLADRILIMAHGELRAEFDARTATEEQLAHAALGAEEDEVA